MKTIGLLGGMSWESTQSYYRALNEGVKNALGGLHSAKIALISVDFAEIEALQHNGGWDKTADLLCNAARNVERAGADGLLICTNTMHKVAPEISETIDIPLIHIADATAQKLVEDGIHSVGLLGTKFTMEEDFYKGRLRDQFGLDVLVPEAAQQQWVHDVIYDELCKGVIRNDSRELYVSIIDELVERGAQAVILGCTEIALLVSERDTDVKLYDTTQIHVEKALQWALGVGE